MNIWVSIGTLLFDTISINKIFGHKTTELGVRSVFTLKPEVNIISGDGKDNAYIMETM